MNLQLAIAPWLIVVTEFEMVIDVLALGHCIKVFSTLYNIIFH